MTDTIAAIATALSPSAIGILRLSGPETKNVLDAVFFPLNDKPMSQQAPRTMVLGHLLDGEGRVLDSALCVLFPGPGSYTGEDCAEIHCHGSPIVLTAREFDVLALLMAHAGTVLTRERIAHEALGYEYVGDTNNVDVHIAHLRAKIEDAGGARIIQTVRGVGYVCRA